MPRNPFAASLAAVLRERAVNAGLLAEALLIRRALRRGERVCGVGAHFGLRGACRDCRAAV